MGTLVNTWEEMWERQMLGLNRMVVLPGKDNGGNCDVSRSDFMKHLMNPHRFTGFGGVMDRMPLQYFFQMPLS